MGKDNIFDNINKGNDIQMVRRVVLLDVIIGNKVPNGNVNVSPLVNEDREVEKLLGKGTIVLNHELKATDVVWIAKNVEVLFKGLVATSHNGIAEKIALAN